MKIKAIFALTTCCSISAFAAPTKYIVGVEPQDYFPCYSFDSKADAKDHVAGPAILDAFAKEAGIVFDYRPLPINRLFSDFIDEKIDFKYPDNPKWKGVNKEGKKIAYSDSVMEYVDGVMVVPEKKGKGISKLKRLGIVMGFTPWDFMGEIKAGKVKVLENSDFKMLFAQVLQGGSDGVYVNVAVAKKYLDKDMNKKGALVFDSSLAHTKDNYYLSSIKHADVIQKFSTFLKDKKTNMDTVRNSYNLTEN